MMNTALNLPKILGKKILIVGEVGIGKTRLLINIIRELVSNGLSSRVTVIDMAPPRMLNIGGRLLDYDSNLCNKVRYLYSDEIRPPRLIGRSTDEVLEIATKNFEIIDRLIDEYIFNPTDILVINDLTIYIHAGDMNKLSNVIKNAATFIGTAYQGNTLSDDKGSGITLKEKQYITELINIVDEVVRL